MVLDGGEWSNSHAGHFTHRKDPQYPLNMRLGWPLSQYGYFKEKLLSTPTGVSAPHHNGDCFPESETVRARILPSSV
jgi:hypothetical protein